IEQVVRISCVAFFVNLLLPLGIEYAAAGAMISVILGELASLIFLVYQFKRKKTVKIGYRFFDYLKKSRQTVADLFSIALPTTGSRMIGSLFHFLEPIIVAQRLALAGITTTLATKQDGVLTGYVLPLLFLPTFINQSLSIRSEEHTSELQSRF